MSVKTRNDLPPECTVSTEPLNNSNCTEENASEAVLLSLNGWPKHMRALALTPARYRKRSYPDPKKGKPLRNITGKLTVPKFVPSLSNLLWLYIPTALLPGRSHLQSLIACSVKIRREKA